ncbi:hypothetical protein GGR51DRAFT_559988 [Nemania sp. FL0031]|nr:hypothetical protein GGR51DRAFT_559988 [Nemania sp. FL0031]
MNSAQYDEHLGVVRRVLKDEFGLHPKDIRPTAEKPGCPFPNNDFVYRVHLDRSQGQKPKPRAEPGVITIPDNVEHVFMRLYNATAGLNDSNRVQNEVAAMMLAKQALHLYPRHIIPDVYGWESAAKGQGWILMEFMNGIPFDEAISRQPEYEGKCSMLMEVDRILRAFHDELELPSSIKGFGGLSFDDEGNIISGALTTSHCGPFQTYPEMVQSILHERLLESDRYPVLDGWRIREIRPRLEELIYNRVDDIMHEFLDEKKTFIHGDFNLNNILFDTTRGCIAAVINFDLARIGCIVDECLLSFHPRYARLPAPNEKNPERIRLRDALLDGFPIDLPPASEEVEWNIAALWEAELGGHGALTAKCPLNGLSWLYSIGDNIVPKTLSCDAIGKQPTAEDLEKAKLAAETLDFNLSRPPRVLENPRYSKSRLPEEPTLDTLEELALEEPTLKESSIL